MNENKLLGRWGEETAARYLKKKRYRIPAMGYTTRFGEIDVIAENREFIVFCEVKLRKNDEHGAAREFVGAGKQKRVIAAASQWLQENETEKQPRFDVIEIYAPEGVSTKKPGITHLESAFWEGK